MAHRAIPLIAFPLVRTVGMCYMKLCIVYIVKKIALLLGLSKLMSKDSKSYIFRP